MIEIHSFKKSTDVVTSNWCGMSWEEIDEYLDYDPNAPLTDQLNTQLRTCKPNKGRLQQIERFKSTIKKDRLHVKYIKDKRPYTFPINVNPDIRNVDKLEDLIEHFRHIQTVDKVSTLKKSIYAKTSIVFGSNTVSPLLSSLASKIDSPCNMLKTSRLTHSGESIDSMLDDATYELEQVYRSVIICGNIFKLQLRRLRRLHSKLISFANVGFLRFITYVVNQLLCLQNVCPPQAISVLKRSLLLLESSFHDEVQQDDPLSDFPLYATCPGLFLLAPPGTGKTQFTMSCPLGLIDTDWINSKLLDQKPEIMDKLIRNGFSLISNRWEWTKIVSTPVIYIKPKDLVSSLRRKGIIPSELIATFETNKHLYVKERYQSNYKVKPSQNFKLWSEAYEITPNVVTIALSEAECFIHGFVKLLDYFCGRLVNN